MRPALLITAALLLPNAGEAQDMWLELDQLRLAEAAAGDLYADVPAYDPYKVIETDGQPAELAAIYSALDERLPPMKIYSFSNEPATLSAQRTIPTTFLPGSAEDMIVGFIRKYEAGKRGYDAVWHGNRMALPKKPTEMTVCEVRDWQIAAAKGQKSTAIGLFQMVGGTFRTVLKKMDLPCDQLFDETTQDRMGLVLLYGRGWAGFKDGSMSVEDFAYELAGEWAAFPAPYGEDKGYSRYRGVGDNKHQVELAVFLAFLKDLRAQIDKGTATLSEENAQHDDEGVEVVLEQGSDDEGDLAADDQRAAADVVLVAVDSTPRTKIITFTID